MKNIKVLIACEESQIVTKEFRRLEIEAYSCDILTCGGNNPEWHIQCDVREILNENWSMIISFPPCTYLTVSGNRWFDIEKYKDRAKERIELRKKAIDFFMLFANNKCPKIAIENPIGIMNSIYRKPDQIIQPYYFGDPFEKRTCLWLKGLPKLETKNIVDIPKRTVFKSGKSMASWCSNVPVKDRQKIRSKTFPGIAKNIAEQWSICLLN